MSPNEFDRSLMEDLSPLPPAPGGGGQMCGLGRDGDEAAMSYFRWNEKESRENPHG